MSSVPGAGAIIRNFDEVEDPRRRRLIEALTLGALGVGFPAGAVFAQGFFGSRPEKLAPGRSVYRIAGTASVNGTAATPETVVRPGDTVETGRDSEFIFVVGGHSMILRSEARLVIEGGRDKAPSAPSTSWFISGLRLLTGKLLSVSRESRMRLTTATATIGIRGTGWYAESDPERTYFCTCYGTTDVGAVSDPDSKETIISEHHDRPLYILGKAASGKAIRSAPFINHTDQELALIEALVGRTPPFVFPKDDYGGPRRIY
jgi:hypothetical protein